MDDTVITDERPPTTTTTTYPIRKRRRPALSCEQCRHRKIKCDRGKPCRQCMVSKAKMCTYTPVLPSKAHIESNIGFLNSSMPDIVAPSAPPSLPSASNSTANSTTHSPSETLDSGTDRSTLGSILAVKMSETFPALGNSPHFSNYETNGLRGTLSKTRLFGLSHWMHSFGRYNLIACLKEDSTGAPSFNDDLAAGELSNLLDQCKTIGRQSKQKIYDEYLKDQDVRHLVPSRELCDVLINLYFRTSESHYRILHYPSFYKEYLQFWETPESASEPFILKMLLAISLAVTYYQGAEAADLRNLAKKCIFAGNHWLNVIPHEKRRLNISGLQIHCMVLIARHTHGIVGDLCWISVGHLVRAAVCMGFHRDPKHFPKMSPLHAELRRRLWATIIELNVQLSLDSGTNPMISIEDFDTDPPANVNDADILETTKARPVSKPSTVYTQTTLQLILLKSLPLRLRICRFINDFRFDPSYDAVLDYGSQITKACKEALMLIRTAENPDPSIKVTQLQRILLDQMHRRFLLTVHRSYAFKAETDPRYYFSRKVVLDCAMTMANYPTDEAGTTTAPLTQKPHDEYTMYKLFGGGFFKSIMLYIILIAFHEIAQQIEENSPMTPESSRAIQPAMKILYDTLDITAERIGISENNIKGHMFLSAILGQLEYMEQGKSPEAGVMEGARKSTKLCLQLMAERAPQFIKNSAPQPLERNEEWRDPQLGQVDGADIGEFDMQDWNMDFEMPDSWLFGSGWVEDRCW